jgi:hypothetical protein
MSEEIRSNLIVWLQDWLHLEFLAELAEISIEVMSVSDTAIYTNIQRRERRSPI